MRNYKLLNSLLGWLAFAIAALTYSLTVEPTASFWDCGEFIATSYKLLVGHPPGAPFFMILGRFFTLFAADTGSVALMMNLMSAFASAFTILFLFWTITHLGAKIFIKDSQEAWRGWAVLGAGLVGALAYTFSDTFWFSAVEGEVYAMSSLFTAMVFWAILKWESVADEPHANRWIILIAYLMGLSIGVHLLNLLAIPAMVMVYYFKKYEVTRNGVIKAMALSFVILLGILYVLIPGAIKVASWFELMFVNGLGMPFNTGVSVYAVLLTGGIVAGIWYTAKKKKVLLNTIILVVTVILIGYSSFAMIVIRSHANPPMDQNSPEDVFSMMGYLNREQYGDRPLITGQYFTSPIDRNASQAYKGDPVRIKKDGRYEIVDYRTKYVFDSKTTTVFPRMYSSQAHHADQYKMWSGMKKGKKVKVDDDNGQGSKTITIPTFANNLAFFFNYQVNHMYFRYFMWNFAGRQNDIQGHGESHKGNWISGIPLIDNARLGDQSKLSDRYKNNRANNTLFFLPLILGLLGMLFQYSKGKEGKESFWIVMLMFFFTGLAIVLYLNQPPMQPRERDYAYAGSFYAFAIWIGLGVLALVEGAKKFVPGKVATIVSVLASLILVPGLMASENWDDHDRSHCYIARDLANNYLESCDENAIIFTNGDNDTFPLWYAQEVEGCRTDIRVCNLSYLQTDWYIDQMKRKAYKSDPLPFSMEHDQYVTGTRDIVYVIPRKKERVNLVDAINFLKSDNPKTKQIPGQNQSFDHLPAKNFYIPVDSLKVLQKGFVSESAAHLIEPSINLDVTKSHLYKNEMMIMDLLANNNWERPIYFAVTVGNDSYMNLTDYFQLEGFAYQIVPVKKDKNNDQVGRVDADKMYDNVVNKFKWGGFGDDRVYLNENHQRMSYNIRNNLSRLAGALIDRGDLQKGVEILDLAMEKMPASSFPHNFFSIFLAEGYYKANKPEMGDQILQELSKQTLQEINCFGEYASDGRTGAMRELNMGVQLYSQLMQIANTYNREAILKDLETGYKDNQQLFYQFMR
ncbi:DUF2723 domain-containing protein [bacterium]|nr:DUF2723 domain-containing protein [bacterium]